VTLIDSVRVFYTDNTYPLIC